MKKKFWKKRSTKIVLAILSLLVIGIIIWLITGYSLVSKMFTTNYSGGSAFLKLFNSDNQKKLKGEGDGRINVILTGIGGANHPGGTLTDSIMVVSIDPSNKTYTMLSLPRDLYVKVNGYQAGKINEVYANAEKKGKGKGGEATKAVVGELLDLPIHYYLNVDFEGFAKFVDTLEGITINVEKAIYDPTYPDKKMIGYDPLRIKAGNQKMNGELSLKYSRSRHGSAGGDFDRSKRQQQVLQAIQDKALSAGFLTNPKKILDTLSILGNHVKTDFSPIELERLTNIAKTLDRSKTISKVMADGPSGELYADSSSGTFYLYPKGDNYLNIRRIAHEIFTDPDLKRENAKIEILNGSKISGVALTLSDTLKSYGYNVTKVDKTFSTETTTIVDYSSNSKKNTLDFLKTKLKAPIITKNKVSSTTADIIIILGNDYQEKSVNIKESSRK